MGRFDPALPISKEKETKMCIHAWPSSFLEKKNDDGLVQLLQKTFWKVCLHQNQESSK